MTSFQRLAREVNLVRHSHWLEGTKHGRLLTVLRMAPACLLAVQAIQAPVIGAEDTQAAHDGQHILPITFARLAIAWFCLLMVRPPDTACINLRHPLLPVGRPAIILGAFLGWRFWELLPALVTAVVATFVASRTPTDTSDATNISDVFVTIAQGLAIAVIVLAVIGLVRLLFDSYLRDIPTLTSVFVAPIFFAASLSLTPLPPNLTVLYIAPVLTLLGLNLGFYDASLRATSAVPGLVTHMYCSKAFASSTLAGAGLFIAGIISSAPLWHCLALGSALSACSLLWWRIVWACSTGATFGFTLLIQAVLLGGFVGFISAPSAFHYPPARGALVAAVALVGGCGVIGLKNLGTKKAPGEKLSRRLAQISV
ncbi:hypothetical protein ACN4EB_04710 [Corynebacterium macclintockiae]|uniref:hypothetical protein n=1 Tax=Corynebacterium macclintockiae TaxID=2913501 RepID=UPI003EBD96CF